MVLVITVYGFVWVFVFRFEIKDKSPPLTIDK